MSNKARKQVILIVDEIPENLRLLVRILRPDYRLSVASNGEKAMEIVCSDSPPDLILLDIMMPGVDGYEVCKQLKADPKTKDIPIILLTAKDDPEAETRGFEMGALDYIKKPFSTPIIKSRIRTHLELRRQQDRLEARNRELQKVLHELDIRNRFIRQAFGRYLSDDIAAIVFENPEALNVGGEKRDVTILMSDLRGFTAAAEQQPAEQTVDIINIYLEVMTDIILKYHGTIDEFIGDAILVLFGAPVSRGDDACRAVACALEMQLAMPEVNRRCREKGYPEIYQGIGINTGPVVVGNIGSRKRVKYAVVGRNVNLTSRIQSYTLGGQVFISEQTSNACGPILRIDDHLEARLKGINKSIPVYEIGGIGGDFNIYLPIPPKGPEIKKLPYPLNISYEFLIENIPVGEIHEGRLTRFDGKSADIETHRCFRRLTDLKLSLFDENGNLVTEGLYARVTHTFTDSPPLSRINFISVPSEAKHFFSKFQMET
jgi:adenylate cyclase